MPSIFDHVADGGDPAAFDGDGNALLDAVRPDPLPDDFNALLRAGRAT